MRTNSVVPSGVERFFGADEIIVSKTDLKGIITYANPVFLRVAGYREEDILGKPHNLIRHPDMPRCVFKLLWDTIAAGQEIFAYVKNMAANGDHYWVHAHVTPTFGPDGKITGYHSNRRVPSREAVGKAEELYRILRAEEIRAAGERAGMAASLAKMTQILAAANVDYDRFVWSL